MAKKTKNTTKTTAVSAAASALITLTGFPPLVGNNPTTLILAEFPGDCSLYVGEYYVNPSNCFRSIIADKYGLPKPVSYSDLKKCLDTNHIALWDVFETRTINGKNVTNKPNNIAAFLKGHPTICKIIFNGRKAEKEFKKMRILFNKNNLFYAPSTSGALGKTYQIKFNAWAQLLP
ncbi:MAG: DNA-deoxyinosine glycosylase [Bacteroidales bacterium]|nr:DNA-deoxyinosine glycosylase [Bacteroidales bacterium]MBR0055231.1 DNA-deoxyinosine glycosylase [Bacteroidales bacterium]